MSAAEVLPVDNSRCSYSDLHPSECGHCLGTPDLPGGISADGPVAEAGPGSGAAARRAPLPLAIEGTWATAQWPGECGCGCGQQIEVGDDICQATAVGPALERLEFDWCLVTCTRAWEVAP